MHRESILMHSGRSCIASQYPCIAEDHALRVNIHASRKTMHRESMSMHHEKSCIVSQYSCIANSKRRDKISYLVEIYALREDFIPHRNLCIARRFYSSQNFMHHEKIPCLVEIYASREDFMPCRNLRIARRYSCPTRRHALQKMEIMHPKRNI